MKAKDFCKIAHKGQLDKQGKPYYLHPYWVTDYLKSNITNDRDILTVAYLHDVFEDTDFTINALLFGSLSIDNINDKTIDALIAITRYPEENYFEYIDRVSKNDIARVVKQVDIKHNLSRGKINDSLKNRYLKALNMLQNVAEKGM